MKDARKKKKKRYNFEKKALVKQNTLMHINVNYIWISKTIYGYAGNALSVVLLKTIDIKKKHASAFLHASFLHFPPKKIENNSRAHTQPLLPRKAYLIDKHFDLLRNAF